MTVLATEPRNGYDTYLVRIESSGPGYRTFYTLVWFDVSTLGIVQMRPETDRDGDLETIMEPPSRQLFPLHDRMYNTTWTSPFETLEQEIEYVVREPLFVTVLAGRFEAYPVSLYDRNSGSPVLNAAYSHDAGYFVSYGSHEPFELAAWSYHDSHE